MGQLIKVWDPAIRIFHWSLVLLFVVAYVTGEEESSLHVYAGYGILGLILFRLVWGVIGTRYARFTQFIVGPQRVKTYLASFLRGKPEHYIGHNPLGGWMVLALLASLALTTWTGLELYGAQGKGPLAETAIYFAADAHANSDKRESGAGEWWEEVHEFFANFTLLLVVMHISGVLLSSLIHHENLIKSMITGDKKSP